MRAPRPLDLGDEQAGCDIDRQDLAGAGVAPTSLHPGAEPVGLELATLRTALQTATALPLAGWLSLNVTPSLLTHRDELWSTITDAPARELVLEVSEQELIADYDLLRRALDRAPMPVRVAADDAGSRYAGLAHIVALDADYLKIDKYWIDGIDTDPAKRALVAGMQS